ncbi:MAG: dTDP-4-dehydrorhamnose reductase [Bacteroidota bacterium]
MTSILVTGSSGQLGNELKDISKLYSDFFNFYFKDIEDLDITNYDQLDGFLKQNNINFLINCAAYTLVDKAEEDQKKAFLINQTGAKNLALVCQKYKIKLVHISTDYVFDGNSSVPYVENDKTNPNSVYGHSKLKGEEEILSECSEYLIIRTSWLYSVYGNNFVKTIIRLGKERDQLSVVFDQVGSPTNAEDLALALIQIVSKIEIGKVKFKSGIYHFSNEGICSWYDFAIKIHKLSGISCDIIPVETKDYPTLAKRPQYSVLDISKIKLDFGIEIDHWEKAIERCISKMLMS